jgi:hypothetical protein
MLPVIDLAHRGLLLSLVGISAYGLYLGFAGHSARMERGRGVFSFTRSIVPICLSLSRQRCEHIQKSPKFLTQMAVIPVYGTSKRGRPTSRRSTSVIALDFAFEPDTYFCIIKQKEIEKTLAQSAQSAVLGRTT